MRNKILHTKKAQIFPLLLVLVVLILCGYAFFRFLTTSGGFEGALIAPSSVIGLYSSSERFEFFAEESARLAVIQTYYDLAREGDFAADNCLQGEGDYTEFCGLAAELDKKIASQIKSNLDAFKEGYEDDEFGNKFSGIIYEAEVHGDAIKFSSKEEELHMPVQEGIFPYSARYDFKQEISFSLDELGLTDFSEIYDKFISCNGKGTTQEIEACMQELKNFDVKVSTQDKKNLFELTSKKKFFFESSGSPVYEPISINFVS